MYTIDLSDYVCYLNDLMELGPPNLCFFIRNALLNYLVLPALKNLRQDVHPIFIKSYSYLLFTLLKSIND